MTRITPRYEDQGRNSYGQSQPKRKMGGNVIVQIAGMAFATWNLRDVAVLEKALTSNLGLALKMLKSADISPVIPTEDVEGLRSLKLSLKLSTLRDGKLYNLGFLNNVTADIFEPYASQEDIDLAIELALPEVLKAVKAVKLTDITLSASDSDYLAMIAEA